jgi:hypothetical protein
LPAGEDDKHLRLVGPADQLAVLRGLTALRGERERTIFNAAIEALGRALGHQDFGQSHPIDETARSPIKGLVREKRIERGWSQIWIAE